MMVIDPARAAFAVVVTRDARISDRDTVVRTSFDHDQRVVANRPGFGGAAWLIRDSDSEEAGTQRVLQYVLWETRSQADAFLSDSIGEAPPAGAAWATETVVGGLYCVGEVISADGLGRAVIDASDPPEALVTGVISFQPVAGKQAWIDEYNRSETRDYIQYLPGFVSASFFSAESDEGLTELVQWDSMEAFQAAFRDERFREHVNVVNHYSSSEVGSYRVHRTIDGAPRIVADSERTR